MKDTLCVIMGGGRGTRLYPLTKERCKPAVPLAGKYRLIDIPISNCINSGLNRIYVLTQFNSESLNRHITRTYKLDHFSDGFIEIMAAEQTREGADWFQGTADAVRRCLKHFDDPSYKYIVILSGDQLYKMNLREMLDFHKNKRSEITLACNTMCGSENVRHLGVVKLGENNKIHNFIEKPEDPSDLNKAVIKIDDQKCFLVSMGIYIFNKDTLIDVLTKNSKIDFGKEVIPDCFSSNATEAFIYKGYWKDIGSIKNFYDENLLLTNPVPPIDLFDEGWQVFTRPRYLPPVKIKDSRISRSIISEGSIIETAAITHSVIGLRSRIEEKAVIEDSIIMGCDYYESLDEIVRAKREGKPYMGIGRNSVIRKAILDKDVKVGENVRIINEKKLDNFEASNYSIKDGIVIIHKNAIIPPGTLI